MTLPEFVPHPPQERVIGELRRDFYRGVFADPGSGKTPMELEAFRRLRHDFVARRMLLVAPIPVCASTWPDEIAKWRQFKGIRYRYIHGTAKQRLKIMAQPAEIYAINPELLPWLVEQAWDWPDIFKVDESTKLKSIGTRWRAARKKLDMFTRRGIMTGTPAPNGLEDLWPQCYLVDKGEALGRTKTEYLNTFFVPHFRGTHNEWLLRDGSEQLIYKALRPIISRITREELALGIPEPLVVERVVKLPEEARNRYREVAEELATRLQCGEVVAPTAGSRSGKLRQIANGRVYLTWVDEGAVADEVDGKPYDKVHDAKLEALHGLVDELGGKPTIIFYEFKHDLEAIRKLFPKAPQLTSKTGPDELRKLVRQWNLGHIPVMLMHPQSTGHGLNLQDGGHSMIWYSLPWDLEAYQQAVCRLWRQGQQATVRIYHLIAEGTIDRRVSGALGTKDMTQAALLRALEHEVRLAA